MIETKCLEDIFEIDDTIFCVRYSDAWSYAVTKLIVFEVRISKHQEGAYYVSYFDQFGNVSSDICFSSYEQAVKYIEDKLNKGVQTC